MERVSLSPSTAKPLCKCSEGKSYNVSKIAFFLFLHTHARLTFLSTQIHKKNCYTQVYMHTLFCTQGTEHKLQVVFRKGLVLYLYLVMCLIGATYRLWNDVQLIILFI